MLGVGVETRAHVAQSVEHILGKNEVIGSIPIVGSDHEKRERARSTRKGPSPFRGFGGAGGYSSIGRAQHWQC